MRTPWQQQRTWEVVEFSQHTCQSRAQKTLAKLFLLDNNQPLNWIQANYCLWILVLSTLDLSYGLIWHVCLGNLYVCVACTLLQYIWFHDWRSLIHTAALPSMLQSSAAARIDLITTTQHWVAQRPSFAVLLHGTQSSAFEKSTLQIDRRRENMLY